MGNKTSRKQTCIEISEYLREDVFKYSTRHMWRRLDNVTKVDRVLYNLAEDARENVAPCRGCPQTPFSAEVKY